MTMATGVYGKFLLACGTGSPNFQLNAVDTVKLALTSDGFTPNFDTHDRFTDIAPNEVVGTGWTAAQPVGSPTFTQDAANNLVKFSGAAISAAGTSLTGIRGVNLFDDTIATPFPDPLMCSINFGATYNSNAGTLSITWNPNGFMYISY